MPVERKRLQEESLIVAAKEVGHVEGHHVLLFPRGERFEPLIEGKAVRARDALDAVALAHAVELSAGAAIGIAHEDVAVALLLRLDDGRIEGRGNAVRAVMIFGRQAGQFQMVETELLADGQHLTGDHPAADHQNFFRYGAFLACHLHLSLALRRIQPREATPCMPASSPAYSGSLPS